MNLSLNFHQTFAPEVEAIAQLVQFASTYKNEFYTKEEISQYTSIPTGKSSGKVVPHLGYAEAMGLVEVGRNGTKYKITHTSLGELVSEEDPYLIEGITNVLCHYNLSAINSKAEMWSFIFNQIIPNHGVELTNNSLKSSLIRSFEVNDINLSPFRTCYTAERSFGNLGMLEIDEEKYFFKSHKVDRTYKYLYGFLLASVWEKLVPEQSEITYETLSRELGFGVPFLWDEASLTEVLEILQEERILFINRQLTPVTYIKQVSSKYLLNKIYSLLI
ncbi:DUF4007 family protein [Rossellomorea vietnamensis]|uniref:DUF4007 family protein n=1 Tax=Rossellomorea vietnamensis TaxID=218284 RepID=A0A5D4MIQ1_9BACI|nr:DUF4007 family protein [Rossellomorea vietnamensis]TYS01269.1 DUF4007 family protein [Rossellomorea vietnamensis]